MCSREEPLWEPGRSHAGQEGGSREAVHVPLHRVHGRASCTHKIEDQQAITGVNTQEVIARKGFST